MIKYSYGVKLLEYEYIFTQHQTMGESILNIFIGNYKYGWYFFSNLLYFPKNYVYPISKCDSDNSTYWFLSCVEQYLLVFSG